MKRRNDVTGLTTPSKRHKIDPIAEANTVPAAVFQERYLRALPAQHASRGNNRQYTIEHVKVNAITQAVLDACFDLIEATSMADYAASVQGWHPDHKKREMGDELLHYLLVRDEDPSSTTSNELAGFLSFMLTHDSIPCVPVLYVYEIHLAETARRSGLGSKLLELCEYIGTQVGIEKMMLTCFVSNETAFKFYAQRGFIKDETSPEDRQTRKRIVKADIVILCKSIPKETLDEPG